MGELMYWELLDEELLHCSCGVENCPNLRKLHKEIAKKHTAKPLLKIWQYVDQKYWPEKQVVADSLFEHETKVEINDRSFNYWLSRCPDTLNRIIDVYRKNFKKPIFLDNTKLVNIGEKVAKFSEWGVIVLLRDPRGVMNSYKNAGIRKGDSRKLENVVPFCKDFIKSVNRLRNNKNVLIIRYEDFCKNPEHSLGEACDFIGIRFEKRMLGSIHFPISTRGHVIKGNRLLMNHIDKKIELDEQWKNGLSGNDLSLLAKDKELVRLYADFGYNLT